MRFRSGLFAFASFVLSTISVVSFAQRKPDEKPITGDFKITIKQTMSGQASDNTTMIKGLRQREETNMSVGGMNMSQVNITQCDLKRTIQVNDRLRKYLVTPMVSDEGGTTGVGATPSAGASATRGGVVVMTVNTVDTGERKEMFGFTARHLKRTTLMESSPDACQQQKMKIDYDGWYINLEYGLSCDSAAVSQMAARRAAQGCRDRYQTRYTGPSRLGFPLMETMTMYGPDGSASFTITREVTDISRQTLDAALFEAPAGYTEAKTQEEMYAATSATEMMATAQPQAGQTAPANTAPAPANAARAKVGVVEFNNKAKASVSTDELRQQMVATLNGHGIEAVALNASSPGEAEIEAKAKGCTYILFTDIATYKAPSAGKKLGGFLGRATGVGSGDSGKSEAKFDFRLVPVGGTSPKLQSSASGKEETAEASVNAALQAEARAVVSAVGSN